MLSLKHISHHYNQKSILEDVNYQFDAGHLYAIVGESGIGKSTLLSLIAGLENCQKGRLVLKSKTIEDTDSYRKNVSFIFQSYNLISYLNPVENVKIALDIHKQKYTLKQINQVLNRLGLTKELLTKPCSKLSGGQQQRVAIARALALDSDVIIADEPTGNLDKLNAELVLSIFKELKNQNKCIIFVTHDQSLGEQADTLLTIENKQLINIS